MEPLGFDQLHFLVEKWHQYKVKKSGLLFNIHDVSSKDHYLLMVNRALWYQVGPVQSTM